MKAGLKNWDCVLILDDDVTLININEDERYSEYWNDYHQHLGRLGVTPDKAREVIRTVPTVVAAMMLRRGDTDAMICGSIGPFTDHIKHIREVIGLKQGVRDLSTTSGLILPGGTIFICDTHITIEPSAEELAELAVLVSGQVRDFGIQPKVAFVSHSTFGSHNNSSADKVREAVNILFIQATGF